MLMRQLEESIENDVARRSSFFKNNEEYAHHSLLSLLRPVRSADYVHIMISNEYLHSVCVRTDLSTTL